jgi:uncharacterized protein (TIRG00374 family)
MSIRGWITIVTLVLLTAVVLLAWDEIVGAWEMLNSINLWILSLLIPVQVFSYYATGGIIFSYLHSKGNLKSIGHWGMTRMALELNFVNHVLPSGGAAGFSYLGWVLHRHGVRPGRATMAQVVRFAVTFVGFLALLILSVILLAADHQINRITLLLCAGLMFMVVGGSIFMVYVVNSKRRLMEFSSTVTRVANSFWRVVTRGKNPTPVKLEIIKKFFGELHEDYVEIRREKKVLGRPFAWAILATGLDIVLMYICFAAIGVEGHPGILLIAWGLSSVVGVISMAPGGAGAFEAVMIAFLASAGVPADAAIAGTLLARVTLMLGTIIFGYVFYQLTINKYGRKDA